MRRPDADAVMAFLMLQVMGYYSHPDDWRYLNAAFYDFRNSPEWDPIVVAAAQRLWPSVKLAVEAVHQ